METARTKADLLALYPDNTSGDISPQDLRDFVESVAPSYGEMYISTPPANITVPDTNFIKVTGTTTLGEANNFDMPADNRLRYTGAVTQKFLITATAGVDDTVDLGPPPNRFGLFIFDDSGAAGAVDVKSIQTRSRTGITVQAIVELAQNDYVELHIGLLTGTNGLYQVASMNMTARSLFG